MKKQLLFKVMTTTALLNACIQPAFASTELTDINGSFAKDAIQKLAESGIINGKGDGRFDPTGQITRQDFAIILAKALNLNVDSAPAKPTFSDIPADNYAYKYVEAATKAGLIKGMGEGNFGLGQNLSRQDMAVLFSRALNQSAGIDLIAGKGAQLTFSDASSIADYAKDAVGAAVELGLIKGNSDGTFNPQGNASREQVALVASNFLKAQQKIQEDLANQQTGEQANPAPPSAAPEPSAPVNSGSGNTWTPVTPTDTTAPTATILSTNTVTIGDSVKVTSTETGFVYLVPFESIPANVSQLNTWVNGHQAAKAEVTNANGQTFISTEGLAAGTFRAYAVDAAGNISAPSASTVKLITTIQTTSIEFLDPNTIVMNYEEELDSAHKPTAYNEDWETITSDLVIKGFDGDFPYPIHLENEDVTISGQQVIIHLPNPVSAGESLSLSYLPHAEDNALRTVSGKRAQPIEEYQIHYSEADETSLSLSLSPGAAFVINPSLEVNEPVTLLVSPSSENYNKRNIKSLIQVKRGETEENLKYNSTDQDFDIIDADDEEHVLGSVSVVSNSDALTIVQSGDNTGLSITPKNTLTEETNAQLVFTLHEEGKDQTTEVTLDVTIDQKKPTVTSTAYDNGKITLTFDEPIIVPVDNTVSLAYSPSGDFTEGEDTTILNGNRLGFVEGPEIDYLYSVDNNKLVFTLTDEAFSRYGFAAPGSFKVISSDLQDFAKNFTDQTEWVVSFPNPQN